MCYVAMVKSNPECPKIVERVIYRIAHMFKTLDGLAARLRDELNPEMWSVYEGDNHVSVNRVPVGSDPRKSQVAVITDMIII